MWLEDKLKKKKELYFGTKALKIVCSTHVQLSYFSVTIICEL